MEIVRRGNQPVAQVADAEFHSLDAVEQIVGHVARRLVDLVDQDYAAPCPGDGCSVSPSRRRYDGGIGGARQGKGGRIGSPVPFEQVSVGGRVGIEDGLADRPEGEEVLGGQRLTFLRWRELGIGHLADQIEAIEELLCFGQRLCLEAQDRPDSEFPGNPLGQFALAGSRPAGEQQRLGQDQRRIDRFDQPGVGLIARRMTGRLLVGHRVTLRIDPRRWGPAECR